MSNETKRDVLEYYLEMIKALKDPLAAETVREARQRYAAALPDDLPVIPKDVSEHIRWCKGEGGVDNVSDAMDYTCGDIATWLYNERHSDVFARAWVLGVWKVKETGEIVKLEAEK
ncbi:hypothetical protein [Lacticaseibacillus paracasei]|uniref:hypothetical protein n=1 Tax=Lacticaseibacillus paracasei TaxID=1597 RepID=UPI000F0AFEF4|nr:hypothetical protein [Lacticaseibacillus paracasei]RNE19123.1 hypothetical protein FAM3257_02192 [Lacticaseibacillus paracasei]TLQ35196.1 DUF1642 domain-containing protein [Lacticaseibacillus paracasei]